MQRKKRIKSLDFITDTTIRNKIEEAIETNSFLYLMERDHKFDAGTSKEIRRIIILYSASIIEAILLFLYKKKKFSSQKTYYSEIHTLPTKYQQNNESRIVIATQIKKQREERELMLDVLVDFFFDEKIINKVLKSKIDKARDIRNTFHLSKSRKGIHCGVKAVNVSNDAVLETILTVNDYLSKKL